MAKQRYINTKMWEDSWFTSLDQIEQLVFIYFLTNPMTNLCGVYELSKGTIGRAVGLESLMLEEILRRFEESGKVFYRDGWVIIPNFLKHQNIKSPTIKKGIEIGLESVPEHIKQEFIYPIHTLSHLNLNSNLNSNSNAIAKEVADLIKSFENINPACKKFYGNTTQRTACENLIESYGFDRVKNVIEKTLPKTNVMAFFPSITTPLQLNDKWSSLESAIKKQISKNSAEMAKVGVAHW